MGDWIDCYGVLEVEGKEGLVTIEGEGGNEKQVVRLVARLGRVVASRNRNRIDGKDVNFAKVGERSSLLYYMT